MKRIIFFTVLVMVVLFIGAVVFLRSSRNVQSHTTTNTPPMTTTVAAPERPAASAIPSKTNVSLDLVYAPAQGSKQIQDMFGITSNMTPDEIKQKVADWYLEQGRKLAAQDQHPIVFYGKTIDESNQPLIGANVHLSLNGGLAEKDLLSDTDGNFFVSDWVGKLLVIDVSQVGYYSSKNCHAMFDYTTYKPNPLQPEIFHLHKKGVGADLIGTFLNVKMPRDGTFVYVDFLKKGFGENGQMQISQIKPSYETWKKAIEWSFRMAIPDGGFIEENEEFPFEAPTSGYQPIISFDFKADKPDWRTSFKKSYFIVFGTPPRYGRIDIENDITWDGAHISYAINPDGSRNLEPK